MQKKGFFRREKSKALGFWGDVLPDVFSCIEASATADPPFCSRGASPFMTQSFSSLPTPFRTTWVASPLVRPFCLWPFMSGLDVAHVVDGEESFAIPLAKGVDPFMPFLSGSFSWPLQTPFWPFWTVRGEEGDDEVDGLTLIGLNSIPDATKFSMRPPRISRAPVQGDT